MTGGREGLRERGRGGAGGFEGRRVSGRDEGLRKGEFEGGRV